MEKKNPDDFVKLRRCVFIPKPRKKKRGNPNEYFIVPQEGDPKEYDTEEKFCENCKEKRTFKKMWVSDPIQPENLGLKGEKVEPYWIEVCKNCNFPTEGLSIIEQDKEGRQ